VREVERQFLAAHGDNRHPQSTEHVAQEQVLPRALQHYKSEIRLLKYSCSREYADRSFFRQTEELIIN